MTNKLWLINTLKSHCYLASLLQHVNFNNLVDLLTRPISLLLLSLLLTIASVGYFIFLMRLPYIAFSLNALDWVVNYPLIKQN